MLGDLGEAGNDGVAGTGRGQDPQVVRALGLGLPGLSDRPKWLQADAIWKFGGHCRNKHGWVNRQKRGRISRLQAQGCQVPWTTGIHCQRFFKSGHASGWFEVARPAQGQESPAEEEQGFDILAQAEAELEDEPTEYIEEQSQQVEPNRWLNRVGWHVHLQGLDRHQLLQARGALSDDEVELGRICEGVDRMAEAGRDVVLQLTIGNAALFQLNSNTAGSKARKPFHAHVGEDTWARYTEVVKTVFRIILRAEEWPKKERPPYRLTPQQRRRLEEMRQEAGTEQDQDQDELDRAVLEFFIALLDHGYKHGPYESALLSALAVMGLDAKGGWMEPFDYTQKYSAVVKMARFAVALQSQLERAAAEKALEQAGATEDERWEQTPAIYGIMGDKTSRYMKRVADGGTPTPMDWILEARSYGMTMQFSRTIEGKVSWEGDEINFQRISLKMPQVREMLHGMIAEMRRDIMVLAGMPGSDTQALPAIPWGDIKDDHSDRTPGYFFFKDDRNKSWARDWRGFVRKAIQGQPRSRTKWFGGRSELKETAVKEYSVKFEVFREKLLAMMHILGGQPGRGPEILSIRLWNTSQAGTRNVFVDRGMVSFVTTYHKIMWRMDNLHVIFRYIPRELGELFVWWAGLVLPFMQQLQNILKGSTDKSAFVWWREVIKLSATAEEDDASQADMGGEGAEQKRSKGSGPCSTSATGHRRGFAVY